MGQLVEQLDPLLELGDLAPQPVDLIDQAFRVTVLG